MACGVFQGFIGIVACIAVLLLSREVAQESEVLLAIVPERFPSFILTLKIKKLNPAQPDVWWQIMKEL